MTNFACHIIKIIASLSFAKVHEVFVVVVIFLDFCYCTHTKYDWKQS